MTPDPTPTAALRAWFEELQSCVRVLDYDRAEPLFAPDAIGFGTYKDIADGRDALRAEQWSHIWPTIRAFTFRLDALRCGAHGPLAWAICPWDSTPLAAGSAAGSRPGRATIIFEQRDGRWLAVHTHFSLYPQRSS
jgi:ketosteroid isomerase-like protein